MRTSFSVNDMTIHRIVEQESGFTPMLDFLPTLSKETLGENLSWLAPGGYDSASGNVVLFVICFLIIVSMYGGGFSTVPAYLRDMFGTRYVGAIHGILLTAWSMAGIVGPVLINYIREYNVTHGVPKAQAYNTTMYIMAGLLVVGFIANFCVKAVDKRHHMENDVDPRIEPARAQAAAGA